MSRSSDILPQAGAAAGQLRVLVDLTPVLPGGDNGGAKLVALELIPRLARLRPAWRFVLLTQEASHDDLATLDAPNIERRMVLHAPARRAEGFIAGFWRSILRRVPGAVSRRIGRLGYALRQRLRRRHGGSGIDADLLFCPFTAPTYARPSLPVVSIVHDLQHLSYPQFFSAADVAHRDAVLRAVCAEATRIATVSDYTRASVMRHGLLEASRVRTVHSRLAGRLARVKPQMVVLARLGLAPGRFLLYPANFWRHKNHEMLFTAFAIAARNGLAADIGLVCTGAPGDRADFLRRAVTAMGLEARVFFPGYVGSGELSALMAASAGVVFPSLYEGFGLPVLEAMEAGVPVACSDTTALPEISAGAALQFDPRLPASIAKAMLSLCQDDGLRARLIAAGHQRAAEFADAERMAREYLDLFDEAIGEGRPVNTLFGVFEDGWVGRELSLHARTEGRETQLELDVTLPAWAPARVVSIRTGAGANGAEMRIRRGEDRRLRLPLVDGVLRLELDPAFVPSNEDSRELTLKLRYAALRYADGSAEVLREQGEMP